MPIIKRRLDICGRERAWEYLIEAAGQQYRVTARQVGRNEPSFKCTCGVCTESSSLEAIFGENYRMPCTHIAEAQRDLSIARQAAAQMVP